MTTLASLHARVKALRARIPFEEDPREFCLELDEYEDIPVEVRAMIHPFDKVVVRYYPARYLGLSDSEMPGCIGHMSTLTGQVTLLYRDGRKERVQHGRRTRGR